MVRPRRAQTQASRSGVKLPDNKDDSSRMMHCLPRGLWADGTARSSRAIGVCGAVTVFVLSRHWRPFECEGGRQAKVGENVNGGLQHMGALRPDLPIEAMVKIKMVAAEAEVIRLDILRFTPTQTSDGEVNNELNIKLPPSDQRSFCTS